MKKILFFLLLLPFGVNAQMQDTLQTDSIPLPEYDIYEDLNASEDHQGSIRLNETKAIHNLLQWHIQQNKQKKAFSGYRIQIHSVNSYGCDIEKLKELRNTFETHFQDIPAYLKYFDPEFKIRVGNFHSRLESIPTLHRVRKEFPSCYPVKTEITLEELKRIPMQDIPTEPTDSIPTAVPQSIRL